MQTPLLKYVISGILIIGSLYLSAAWLGGGEISFPSLATVRNAFTDSHASSSSSARNLVMEIPLGETTSSTSEVISPASITREEKPVSVKLNNLKGESVPIVISAPPVVMSSSSVTAPTIISAPTSPSTSPLSSLCDFSLSQTPRHTLLINEVAWMGTNASANDEWVEVKNVSGSQVSLKNAHLISKDGSLKITFEKDIILLPGALVLLERSDDRTVPTIAADVIYNGTLSNSGEHLKLFNAQCALLDEVDAIAQWPAGNNETKQTMERNGSDFSWHTSVSVGGTPRAENNIPMSTGIGTPILTSSIVGVTTTTIVIIIPPATTSTEPVTTTTLSVPVPTSTVPSSLSLSHLVISALQITGGTGHTTDDFVEITNPTSQPINLKGIRLVKRTKTGTTDTSLKSWTADTFVSAGGTYTWANSALTPAFVVQATTTGSIADDNGVAFRNGPEDTGTIVDAVAWGTAQNAFVEGAAFPTNPTANQVLRRKTNGGVLQDMDNNAADFEL